MSLLLISVLRTKLRYSGRPASSNQPLAPLSSSLSFSFHVHSTRQYEIQPLIYTLWAHLPHSNLLWAVRSLCCPQPVDRGPCGERWGHQVTPQHIRTASPSQSGQSLRKANPVRYRDHSVSVSLRFSPLRLVPVLPRSVYRMHKITR